MIAEKLSPKDAFNKYYKAEILTQIGRLEEA